MLLQKLCLSLLLERSVLCGAEGYVQGDLSKKNMSSL